jgi:1-aminocyclopropane-1-carboxylate deaminase/D-cysteine desulfhydrase-like pyridoxal-dependent ACC family enzyme
MKMKLKNSPMQEIKENIFNLNNTKVFIKRDDLLENNFTGNKARKLSYFLENDFQIKKLISYGSMQSNNMLSMAALTNIKNIEYIYYVNRDLEYINKHKNEGNLREALKLGMKIISLNNDEYEEIKKIVFKKQGIDKDILYIMEGGSQKEAEYGFKILSEEIIQFVKDNKLKNVKIFLPSGTGTSSLFLQKNLKFPVYTTNCVSNEKYLKEQFQHLSKNSKEYPIIINTKKNYKYGKLYKEHYQKLEEIKNSSNIEFEYIYDAKGIFSIEENKNEFENSTLIYIHCGGILGNEIMNKRYIEKFPELSNNKNYLISENLNLLN